MRAGKFLQGHLECEPPSVNHCHQVNVRVNMGVFALLCPMSTHKICRAYHVQDHARTSDRMSSGCAQHPPTRISVRPRSKSSHITALQECSRKLRQNRNEKGQERDNSLLAACAVDMHMDIIKITIQGKKNPGKMPQAKTATTVFCEPAQSECTWTGPKN